LIIEVKTLLIRGNLNSPADMYSFNIL